MRVYLHRHVTVAGTGRRVPDGTPSGACLSLHVRVSWHSELEVITNVLLRGTSPRQLRQHLTETYLHISVLLTRAACNRLIRFITILVNKPAGLTA
jgi:hypothetical protein